MKMTTEVSSRLLKLASKYGDFKVARGYSVGDVRKFTKRKGVMELWGSEKGIEFLNKVNCRQVLPCEIILDMDNDISVERLNNICDDLDNYGFNYEAYSTGSKGYHIHIFEDELIKYSEKARHEIRHYLISKHNCDGHIASGNVLIAIENMAHFKTGNKKTLVRKSK